MPYSAISWTVLAKQRIFPWTSVNQVKKTKRQQEFNKLRGKVITLKEQNKTKEQKYVAELKLMECVGTNNQVICWFHKQG